MVSALGVLCSGSTIGVLRKRRSSLVWQCLGNWALEMGKLLIDVEISVHFKFIFTISTMAMEIAIPHVLEADVLT